jgi:Helix-turn-helix domain
MTTTTSRDIEPFVDAGNAAQFLVITRRRLLEMARAGQIPAHAIGEGKRKMWRFRLSELAEAIVARKTAITRQKEGIIDAGSPRQPNRRN